MSVKYDSVYVWAGNLGVEKKIGSVSVPKECWKVVYIKKKNEYHYFIFRNTSDKPDGMENNRVTKSDLEKKTGFKFRK
jgi:DNA/RNA endonuclease G (NUC1)